MSTDDGEVLPSGYDLEEYRIESVLGRGGFGVTYLARDTQLEQRVAIKEYFPGRFAQRDPDRTIRPNTAEAAEEIFRRFLKSFLNEARTLAKLSHPNIVRVRRYFPKHGTAYMVMDYEDGTSLAHAANPGAVDEHWIRGLLPPLLDALEAVHKAQFLHRDLKPANILIRKDGSPLLLDFGSARPVEEAGNLTAVFTPRYGAFEQYTEGRTEGPWTDIRGLAAVLYWLVVGVPPIDDQQRYEAAEGGELRPCDPDPLESAQKTCAGRCNANLLKAIDWGLRLRESARPQSVSEWRRGRGEEVGLNAFADAATATTLTRPVTPAVAPTAAPPTRSWARPAAWAAGVSGIAASVALALFLTLPRFDPELQTAIDPEPPTAAPTAAALPAVTSDSEIAALGIVDGSDPRYGADPDLLLDDLRADARRQAIEKAVGIFVESEALQSRYSSLEQEIFGRKDFVERLVDDAQPHRGADGFVYLPAVADVRLQDLRKVVYRLSRAERIALIRAQGNPLISVAVSIRDADRGSPIERSALAENVIKERIRDFGFRVASRRDVAADGSAPRPDFAVESEAKLKRLSHTLAASGVTIEKYVLTSWTVKASDERSGEDIYFDNRLPESGSWADEDRALQEIGTLIADAFSRDFFAEHLPRMSRRSRLAIHDVPSPQSAKLLALSLLGLRPVSHVTMKGLSEETARFELAWYDQGPGGEQSFDGIVLAPLRRKLGRDCLVAEGGLGSEDFAVRLSEACTRDLVARLEGLPVASLSDAPAERLAAVARSVATMRKLALLNPTGVSTLAARGSILARDALVPASSTLRVDL